MTRRSTDNGLDLATLRKTIYWWDTVKVETNLPLHGSHTADVTIVGAGFTGLWTAYQLIRKDPSLEITVLESGWAGCGASGHNDGFAISVVGLSLHDLVKEFGAGRARAAHSAVATSIEEIGRFCEEHGCHDVGYKMPGFLAIARDKGELARIEADHSAAIAMGNEDEFQLLSGSETRELIDVPRLIGGLVERRGAQINPLAMNRHLARVVQELGVKLYENTPVLEIQPGEAIVCRTPEAKVTSDSAVIATNAYSWQLPFFKNKVLPLWSYALVSAPLTDEQLSRVSWKDHIGYEDKRTYVSDGRITADNRFLCGGAEAIYFFRNSMNPGHASHPRPYEQLSRDAHDLFPMWSDLRWEYAYAGCMGMTPTFTPYFGSLRPNLHYGVGYNGHGVAPSHTGGKVLRDLVLGTSSDFTELVFVTSRELRWPPEPLKLVGATITSRLVLKNDRSLHKKDPNKALDPLIMKFNRRVFKLFG